MSDAKHDPAEVIRELREQAFSVSATELGVVPGAGHQHVWAVFMDTGLGAAFVSLITIADGTTSLYFSNGGGVIGAGEHPAVRTASRRLIALVDECVTEFTTAEDHSAPAAGRVRFYARTFDGLHGFEASEDELGNGRHRHSKLFHAAHDVIAAIRESTPENR